MPKGSNLITHGLLRGGKPPEYFIWRQMKQRCSNPNDQAYGRYGAIGITVCERWANSFEAFIQDMGWRPSPELSLDRIDGNKGYFPENVKWSNDKEQSTNRKNVTLVKHNGEMVSLKEYCRLEGLEYGTIKSRIKRDGWTVEEAIIPGGSFRRRKRNEPWKNLGISRTTFYRRSKKQEEIKNGN